MVKRVDIGGERERGKTQWGGWRGGGARKGMSSLYPYERRV